MPNTLAALDVPWLWLFVVGGGLALLLALVVMVYAASFWFRAKGRAAEEQAEAIAKMAGALTRLADQWERRQP